MFDIIKVKKWWFNMRKNIKHFVCHCFECQLTIKFKDVKRNVMHSSNIWFDRSQLFERWELNLIESLFITKKSNRWIVICIDYNIKWSITRAISNVIAKTLIEFVINNIYRDYETFKKIIIDKEVNLWTTTMKLIFETLKIKHKDITLYHSRINETIKRFNDVLDHILTKYCIDELIKNWNLYLNQTLFATRIRTHIIIDFFFF